MEITSFLYAQALAFFGEKVHAVRDEQWGTEAEAGLTVWQLVASIALHQYRVALTARGVKDETIEAQLPGDPLGIAPADGWDLAAERGRLAVFPPDDPPFFGDQLWRDRLVHLLPGVISRQSVVAPNWHVSLASNQKCRLR